MTDILVPIALSSQLDVTGEERIHAAKYTPATRSTWFAPPWEYFITQSGTFGIGSATSTYGRVRTDTFEVEELAQLTLAGTYPPVSHAGFNMGGDLILLHNSTNGDLTQGVYAYRLTSGSLVEHAFWAKNPELQYDRYWSITKWDEATVIVTAYENLGVSRLIALSYDGTGFTVIDDISMGDSNYWQAVKHKNHIIAFRYALGSPNDGLRAYSFDGETFALVATYSGVVGGQGTATDRLEADDSYIYTGDNRIFSFNGSNALSLVTTVTGTASTGTKFATTSGKYLRVNSSQDIDVYDFDGASTALTGTLAGTYSGHGWLTMNGNLLFMLGPYSVGDESAIFSLSGSTLTREADLHITNVGSRERNSLTFIDALTEY